MQRAFIDAAPTPLGKQLRARLFKNEGSAEERGVVRKAFQDFIRGEERRAFEERQDTADQTRLQQEREGNQETPPTPLSSVTTYDRLVQLEKRVLTIEKMGYSPSAGLTNNDAYDALVLSEQTADRFNNIRGGYGIFVENDYHTAHPVIHWRRPPFDFWPELKGAYVETAIGTMRIGGQKVEIAATTVALGTAVQLTGSVEWVYAAVDRATTYGAGSIKHSSTEPVSTSSELVFVIARYDAVATGVYQLTRICLTDAQYDLPTR